MASSETPQTTIESVISSPSVLEALANECMGIFRETAAAFRKPVMLYSIGKDTSVLLHLPSKAFTPGLLSFRDESAQLRLSERATRLIDGDKEDSMDKKETEGYF